MYTDAQKIHLLEQIIATHDELVLQQVARLLKNKAGADSKPAISALSLAGLWTEEDAADIRKTISEGCDQINPDDWK